MPHPVTEDPCPTCGAPVEAALGVCVPCYDRAAYRTIPQPASPATEFEVALHGMAATVAPLPNPVLTIGLVVGSLVLSVVFQSGIPLVLPVWAIVFWQRASPLRVEVDAHALTVGSSRLLWEDLAGVDVAVDRIRWRLHDGSHGAVRLPMSATGRSDLQRVVEERIVPALGPRDHTAESAVRALVDQVADR